MKILVIDDNERLAKRTKDKLQKWYIVELAYSGEAGLQALTDAPFDLILLDLGLPGMTGEETCRQIKTFWPEIAILVTTGEDSTASKVNLLEIGADDYITKPYETAELHARIRALLRRKQAAGYREKIVIDSLELDPNTRTVTREGTPITLRRKEFNILEYLCMNPGRILTREMIVLQAWPANANNWTGSVDVHIKQIRDKIDKPFQKKLLKTAYGLGYMIESHSDGGTE
ncbi:response regulator transcription factor [Candidatus Saccharibacteria bacterium TM7i]|nr:response regulator transcription factor [Candidatus Saccharibacteria bacterium TM7i]